ncbi:gamma-glutamyltransferase [Hyphomicrobium sp. xq]|uniref:Glutathione hydrolase proenzyme n=1 Tax=Hyphomicrobium album TaxID=2665159 RepID=A0A6I3KKD4_9HYPH|nr:gamma-glutamyltransferase [Hyphomicrobium album]MTD94207.1 gamma-glutamyltransferase [Hyphomicrobium album]
MLLRPLNCLLAPLLAILLAASAEAQLLDPRSSPEAATGEQTHELAIGKRHMVSAANALAAEAGREMLRAGGSAIDAAIATQLVLNLVEPQSSGIGGGAFILYWDKAKAELKVYDGRETAPASATPDRFLVDGKPMPFNKAVLSGLSVGVPGLVRLLEDVHKQHGKLAWAKLFEPAIRLAEGGFEISQRLHVLLRLDGPDSFVPAARRYFFTDGGSALPIGHRLRNAEFAATLRAIAAGGANAFYEGPIAQAIVDAVAAAPTAPGGMTLDDLKNYRVKERPPLCVSYRAHEVCGVGPPSSGGPTVAQTLKLIEPLDIGTTPDAALNARAVHLITEAEKLAFADRNKYVGDPDFVAVPDGLLDDAYIAERRKLIDPQRGVDKPKAGEPPGLKRQSFGVDATIERSGTSHISIVDEAGNAVSMTTTIEGGFGSHNWAAGFLLNNELTDFSFAPVDAAGQPVANAVAPGKRPRSSMAPTIVFDTQRNVEAVLGSPGGSRIILYVLKTLVALLDWGLDAQRAADLTNFGSQGSGLEIELDWAAVPLGLTLRPLGHRIVPSLMNSGIHIVMRRDGRLEGAADARREGAALGD